MIARIRGAAVRARSRGGGLLAPLLTTVLAFLVGGLVVLATGHSPFATYEAIFSGTGLDWLEPWVGGAERQAAAINLQQTLLLATPLILCGLAVAYAFRAGLFNIGAQGQYLAGAIVAVWVGSSFAGMPGWLHVLLTITLAAAAGAAWAAIAGLLRATVGANEVITTIMLNYTAVWVGVYAFGLGGPLQSSTQRSVPISDDVVASARLPVFWGDAELQGLHVGIFVALAAAVVFAVLLTRSTRGFEARAVGLNADAAAASGIPVGRTYVRVMATCGAFAGLAGAMDLLGWQFHLATNDIQLSQVGFLGIAVALLGRNTAIGTCAAALLFSALVNGTSVRHLDPAVFPPQLAGNLTTIIQGVVVLLLSADVIGRWLVRRRRGASATPGTPAVGGAPAAAEPAEVAA
jgi:general nucleoside transport system permease protein